MNTQQDKNIDDMLGPSEHLQRAFSLINRVPTIYRYSKLQRKTKELDTVANIVYKYGSWDNALQCTFPNIHPITDYSHLIVSKADVISTLNELRKTYSSSQPKIRGDLRKRVRLLFGNWSQGLIEAGVGIKKEVLREIYKRSTSEHNIRTALSIARMEIRGKLSIAKYDKIRKEKHRLWPSHKSIIDNYGGWKEALDNFNISLFEKEEGELPVEYPSEIIYTVEKLKRTLICRPFITRDDIPDSFDSEDVRLVKKLIGSDLVYLKSNGISTMLLKMIQRGFPVSADQVAEKGRQFALMYASGLPIDQISTIAQASKNNVRKYISKYFYEIDNNKKPAKNLNSKETPDFDSKRYQYAANLGFPPVTPERYYTERKIAIGRMGASRLQKGETLDDIAKSLFISCNSLKVYINRYLYKVSKLKCDETEQ